jgi:hypothetical protein
MIKLSEIVLYMYNRYYNNSVKFYEGLKMFNIMLLSTSTSNSSGIVCREGVRYYYYILNNKIDIEVL